MSAAVSSDWDASEVAVPTIVRAADQSASGATAATTGSAADADNIDAVAAAAFRSLRLAASPPVHDDESLDRADPFQRHQQPSPQHALFDPNGTYPQSVSPATATAAVARYGQLDSVLLAGLENSRERLSLLKFEDQIVRFIKNPREVQLSFPPLSSYHRLIIHRLAERCCLEHQTGDFSPYTPGGYDGNSSRVVTLFKSPQTVIPRVLLIDLSADMQQPAVTPASAPKIMMRKRNAMRGAGNGGRGDAQDAKSQQRSIEDRERAYAEARARIFGEESSSATDASMLSTSSPATATATSGASQKFGGGTQAIGPDGSKGFARGGARGNAGSGNPVANSRQREPSPSHNGAGRHDRSSSNSGNSSRQGPAGGEGSKSQQNWKESKVLWRNREQELNDPDFTRNHDAFRPSRDQHFQGGGGRFNGGANYYYDGPRSTGYQTAQPPYPGRSRGPPHNEYSRIDSRQTQPPPPPPPSDFYRHHSQHPGQIHPPPPPPRGYHSSYSPHGRGYGGAPPPPPPTSSHHQFRRGSTGGGYNDDFPPLGK